MKRLLKKINIVFISFLVITVFFSATAVAAPYTIKSGDTLWKIAQRHGTSPMALMKANKLKSTMLLIGQKINVPDSSTHFVNYGDTLWKIARKYGRTVSELVKYNGIQNPSNLQIGQIIKIPPASSGSGWKAKADRLIQAGLKYKGVKYRLGADYDKDGSYLFDCSSFTQKAYADIGIKIKRSSRSQYKYPPGRYIKQSELRRGDLVFFDYMRDGRIDHVAIYYGPGQLLHTYRNPQGVEVGSFSSYWKTRYVGSKRIIE